LPVVLTLTLSFNGVVQGTIKACFGAP
jgi:hypothetical protein